MKVYLDDERTPPEGWRLVRWPEEAIAALESHQVTELSLDHDLGDDEHGTGYDVVCWVEEAVVRRRFRPPAMRVHSANPAARERMEAGIAAVQRLVRAEPGPGVLLEVDGAQSVVHLSGAWKLQDSDPVVQLVDVLVTDGAREVVFEMSHVTRLRDKTLELPLRIARRLHDLGGTTSIRNPSPAARELIEALGFDRVVQVEE